MSAARVEIRRGAYADSVTLMQLTREISAVEGVTATQVAMATELNLQLLLELGFAAPHGVSPNDLFIAIRANDDEALEHALTLTRSGLDVPRPSRASAANGVAQPRTVGVAARQAQAHLAVISVPGPHAFTEAMDALDANCDVLLFSDNVSVEQEIVLKDSAARRGRLVMGPDCGTAVVDGIALGFAHRVARGPVGIVAASGTGAQQVLCLLDAASVGVADVLGVGGRDLSAAVAGRSTIEALRRLDADPVTELIIVISKPPAAVTADRVRSLVRTLRTPVRFALLGPGQPDLTEATVRTLRALRRDVPVWRSWRRSARQVNGTLCGLFYGGTLCDEAMLIASAVLGPIRSNVPLHPDWVIGRELRASGHVMIDFGEDTLTRGRAHPMIDPTLRVRYLRDALADAATGVVLLDVLLGYGSPADPVAQLLPMISGARVPIVVTLIGARDDPQGLVSIAERLHAAGASVFTSNAEATRFAVSLVRDDT